MSTVAYSDHDLYTQITTGALGTVCAPFVTEGGSAGLQGIANIVNDPTNAQFQADVPHDDMPQGDVGVLPDYGDWALMTANQISTWDSIVALQVIKIGDPNIQSGLESAFANAPTSLGNVREKYTQKGSWAQGRYGKLDANGQPFAITTDNIQNALTNK